MGKNSQSIEDLLNPEEQVKDEDSSLGKFTKKMQEINLKEIELSAQSLAEAQGFGYINLVGFPITPESLALIDEAEAKKLQAVCFYSDFENIRIGALDPHQPEVKAKLLELQGKLFTPNASIYLLSQHSFDYAMKLYATLPKFKKNKLGLEIKGADLEKYQKEISNINNLDDKINTVNISDVMTIVIASALKLGSSDIHIETEEKGIAVRLRVDGVLQTAAQIDSKRWLRIAARLKILSGVKINVTDKPQDGRFTIFLEDSKIDVRVSFLPTSYGESVVMRLLESTVTGLQLDSLGMIPQVLEILKTEIDKPNGLILTTGPTGSGKTTTLYAILNQLNKPGTKIITLEDPVEYKLPGINQSQIDEKKDYTFAKGLRSILRQDPDIIMIGEIRDLETAEISIQSSLTGHLVLSTLHTNDSAGVIPRLLDLGVKPFLLTPSINAIMAQRLIRKLCPACRTEHNLTIAETERVKKILAVISTKAQIDIPSELPTMYQAGPGCEACGGVGYKGRTGIYEVFTMTNDIKQITADGAPAFKILEKAIEAGMITMLQDGVLKAMSGVTSLEEVYKVAGKMDYVDALYDIVVSKTIGRGITVTSDHLVEADVIAHDFINSSDRISKYKTSDMLSLLVATAVKTDASDIHIDPIEHGVRLRLRIDGILHDIASLGAEYYVPLIGSIKDLAGFSIQSKQATYDGRFSIFMPDSRLDCRVSIITGGYGETAVLRILSKQAKNLDLEDLGIKYSTLDSIKNSVTKTKGIIINTGPTGSGKTTTLYAILNKLNRPDIKIITIEDPIEYNLEGVMQTQIDEKVGYTFEAAIRSLMRQNPNIIMVGEVRDAATARVAIEAALTGHLVLSTVHANSAASAIARFYELGVERQLLASSIECSIGQRLVRKICQDCKEELILDEKTLEEVKGVLSKLNPASGVQIPTEYKFYHGKGCPSCGGIGYKGRIGLYEAIVVNPEIKKLIIDPTSIDNDIETAAVEQGFITVMQDGLLKALEGNTTVEEVFRVAK
ncbi:MAG TPA: GspE/PulE family protein [bacterium]|nr:GspE/PulE family protein [bacterium]